ncbi:MAG: aldehyde dehydrogenase family protein, partial [Gemmatimonadota bacterium]
MAMESVNPATGQVIATFEELTDAELDARLERAEAAFRRYRETTYAQRAERLARLADLLEGRAEELGRLMTEEMGKPIGAAVAEAKKCALACRYYVEHGEEHLADEPVEVGGARAYIRHLPIGPVLAIMPWNFPFWQVIRFAAPA